MKRFLGLLLATVLVITSFTVVCAKEEVTVKVDGKAVSYADAKTCVSGERIMVPSKFVKDYLGADVTWEEDSQTTVIKKGSSFMRLKAGENTISVNNLGEKKMESVNLLENGVAYVPVRFVAEALNAKVSWDEETKTVDITTAAPVAMSDEVKQLLSNVSNYNQSTIRIQGEKVVYIDPTSIYGEPHDADIILITHTHSDHFLLADIKKLAKDTTVLVIPESGIKKVKDFDTCKVMSVNPMNDYEINGIKVKTVPAYNIGKDFHKKESNLVGYIVYINNASYYMAGDLDIIPELKDIKADVVFLPVGGTYTMTDEEAAKAANTIMPKVAVPIHFTDVVGSEDNARKFISLLDKKISGVILRFKL